MCDLIMAGKLFDINPQSGKPNELSVIELFRNGLKSSIRCKSQNLRDLHEARSKFNKVYATFLSTDRGNT